MQWARLTRLLLTASALAWSGHAYGQTPPTVTGSAPADRLTLSNVDLFLGGSWLTGPAQQQTCRKEPAGWTPQLTGYEGAQFWILFSLVPENALLRRSTSGPPPSKLSLQRVAEYEADGTLAPCPLTDMEVGGNALHEFWLASIDAGKYLGTLSVDMDGTGYAPRVQFELNVRPSLTLRVGEVDDASPRYAMSEAGFFASLSLPWSPGTPATVSWRMPFCDDLFTASMTGTGWPALVYAIGPDGVPLVDGDGTPIEYYSPAGTMPLPVTENDRQFTVFGSLLDTIEHRQEGPNPGDFFRKSHDNYEGATAIRKVDVTFVSLAGLSANIGGRSETVSSSSVVPVWYASPEETVSLTTTASPTGVAWPSGLPTVELVKAPQGVPAFSSVGGGEYVLPANVRGVYRFRAACGNALAADVSTANSLALQAWQPDNTANTVTDDSPTGDDPGIFVPAEVGKVAHVSVRALIPPGVTGTPVIVASGETHTTTEAIDVALPALTQPGTKPYDIAAELVDEQQQTIAGTQRKVTVTLVAIAVTLTVAPTTIAADGSATSLATATVVPAGRVLKWTLEDNAPGARRTIVDNDTSDGTAMVEVATGTSGGTVIVKVADADVADCYATKMLTIVKVSLDSLSRDVICANDAATTLATATVTPAGRALTWTLEDNSEAAFVSVEDADTSDGIGTAKVTAGTTGGTVIVKVADAALPTCYATKLLTLVRLSIDSLVPEVLLADSTATALAKATIAPPGRTVRWTLEDNSANMKITATDVATSDGGATAEIRAGLRAGTAVIKIADAALDTCFSTRLLMVSPAKLFEVTFSRLDLPMHALRSDNDATPFISPHYRDNNLNGVADDMADDPLDRRYPIAYTRGNIIRARATFKLGTPLPPGTTAKVKATGTDGLDIPVTDAAVHPNDNRLISIPDTSTVRALDNWVQAIDPLTLSWYVSLDGGTNWSPCGSSHNKVYVTWANPSLPLAQSHETIFSIACANSPRTTETDVQVLDRVWAYLKERNVRRVSDDFVLTYYGFYDTNKNGAYDTGEPDRNTPFQDHLPNTASGLIIGGNGECFAWARLMGLVLLSHGLTEINGKATRLVGLHLNTSFGLQIMVKVYCTTGQSPRKIRSGYSDLTGSAFLAPDPGSSEAADYVGIAGQGNSPNPYAIFGDHAVVRANGFIYDPSYGIGGTYDDIKSYENDALSGTLHFIDGGWYLLDLPACEVTDPTYMSFF